MFTFGRASSAVVPPGLLQENNTCVPFYTIPGGTAPLPKSLLYYSLWICLRTGVSNNPLPFEKSLLASIYHIQSFLVVLQNLQFCSTMVKELENSCWTLQLICIVKYKHIKRSQSWNKCLILLVYLFSKLYKLLKSDLKHTCKLLLHYYHPNHPDCLKLIFSKKLPTHFSGSSYSGFRVYLEERVGEPIWQPQNSNWADGPRAQMLPSDFFSPS